MSIQKGNKVEICPDNHRCENGSICVENSRAEGKYFCDCEESMLNGATVFSGLYCQHEATVYCTITGKVSRTSFCTNLGTCRGNVEDNKEHLGCDCPRGYTGTHCQFVEGSEGPEGFIGNGGTEPPVVNDVKKDRGGDGAGMGTPGLVLIILLVLAVLGAAFGVAYRRQKQHAATHTIESTKSTDGNLPEPDGSTSLAAMPTKTQTFESDGDHDELQINAVDSGHLA